MSSGADAVIQYVTGYLLEWSLSVDNIFVIALIFSYLRIPSLYQYRVLFWGIVGAIVLRGLMIAAGTALRAQVRLDVLRLRGGAARLGAQDARARRGGAGRREQLGDEGRPPFHAGDARHHELAVHGTP